MKKYEVMNVEEATKIGVADAVLFGDLYTNLLIDTDTLEIIASDAMEPEDVTFYRDLAWVPKLLNELYDNWQDQKAM